MKARRLTRAAPSLALAAILGTLAHAGLARAQGGGFVLDWEAPKGCPSREAVLGRLRTMVGKSLERADRLRAEGRIEAANGRYRLTLKVRAGAADTVREIESNSCSDLAGAAAVALGLLVRDGPTTQGASDGASDASDGLSASGDRAAATTPATAQTAEPDRRNSNAEKTKEPANRPPEPVPRSEPAPQTSDSSRVRFLLRAPQIGIDIGPLPHPNPTFGLAAGVGFAALELTIGARLGLGQTVRVDGTPAYGAEIRRGAIELRGCYAFSSGRFSSGPCLLTALDPLSARGVGDEVTAQSQSTLVFAVGGAAFARFRLGEFLALVASIGAQVETSRPRLVVDGLSEVAKLDPFAVTSSFGVEWIL